MRLVHQSSLLLIVLSVPIAGCGRAEKREGPPVAESKQDESVPAKEPAPEVPKAAAAAPDVVLHVEGMV